MIQRIQTVFLALASICGILLLFIPSFSVGPLKATMSDETIYTIFVIAISLFPVFTIMMYNNRPQQIRFGFISISLVFAVCAAFMFMERDYLSYITLELGAALPMLMIIFNLLAIRAIKKDEELVRSADRFRD